MEFSSNSKLTYQISEHGATPDETISVSTLSETSGGDGSIELSLPPETQVYTVNVGGPEDKTTTYYNTEPATWLSNTCFSICCVSKEAEPILVTSEEAAASLVTQYILVNALDSPITGHLEYLFSKIMFTNLKK